MNTVKWGILSAAEIAEKFVVSNALVENSEIVAVGARTYERAKQFAERNGIAKAYGSYEELLQDAEINAIYVATVHSCHYQWVMAALHAGKHVLCEKSFGLSPDEVIECKNLAEEKGLFLMEAMWMRFLPIFPHVFRWIQEGRIGKVKQVRADFSLAGENPRLFDKAVGGGGLLDTGVYPLNFACMFLGYDPIQVTGVAHVENGVDYGAAYTLLYPDGGLAVLSCAVDFEGGKDARITGTKGYIAFDHHFWEAEKASLFVNGELVEEAAAPHGDTGFCFEIQESVNCILSNKQQSEIMPMSDTLKIANIQAKLFDDWGVSFSS